MKRRHVRCLVRKETATCSSDGMVLGYSIGNIAGTGSLRGVAQEGASGRTLRNASKGRTHREAAGA